MFISQQQEQNNLKFYENFKVKDILIVRIEKMLFNLKMKLEWFAKKSNKVFSSSKPHSDIIH